MADPRLQELGLTDSDDVFALAGEIVSSDPRSRTMRVETSRGAVFVKTFRYLGVISRITRLFAPSHCRREAANFAIMGRLEVGCPEVLAWGEERVFAAPARAFLITAEIPGARSLADLLESNELVEPRRRRLSVRLAAQIASLHEAGYLDRDFKFRNILVDAEGEPYHVDSPKGRLLGKALGSGQAAIDLGMLDKHAARHFSSLERLRFVLAYARLRRLDRPELRRLLEQIRSRSLELHRRGATPG